MCVISATRERLADEIVPVSAEQSGTSNNNTAAQAIDMDWNTMASTASGSDGRIWIKVNVAKLSCIQQVIRYGYGNYRFNTWTCTNSECSEEGSSHIRITISSERTSSDNLPPIADCKYGDTVTLGMAGDLYGFDVPEIAIIGKQGEMKNWYLSCTVLLANIHNDI